jgi:hypothetical protein
VNIVTYLVERVPWAVVGLLIGHLLSRGICDLHAVAVVVNPEETDMTARPHRPWYRRITSNGVIGAVVFVLAVATVVQGYVQNEQTQRIAECTRGYSNGFADALDSRSEANAAAQQALDDLMTKVGELSSGVSTPDSRATFRAALNDYLNKRAEAKKKQAEHPFPPAPRDVCN